MCLNSSSAGSSGTIFKIQKVVKNHNHITFFFFFFFGLLISVPDDCGYSLKLDNGTFSSLFLEYLFIYLAVSGLICSMQDLLLRWTDSPVVVHGLRFSQHVGSPTRDPTPGPPHHKADS